MRIRIFLFAPTFMSVAATLPLAAGAPAAGKVPAEIVATSPARGHWRVTAGVMQRSLGGFDWAPATHSLPGLLLIGAGSSNAGIGAIGAAGSYADRVYTDGFVKLDGGTVALGGDTWNWGYADGSQVDAGFLSFHGGNGTAVSVMADSTLRAGRWSDQPEAVAPYVQLEWIEPLNEHLNFGWLGGFSFLTSDVSRAGSTFSASKGRTDYDIRYTDRYDLGGVVPPGAPYSGSLAGPGPLISNLPEQRSAAYPVSGGETASAYNRIQTDSSVNLWTLSLGPSIEYTRGRIAIGASAGATVAIADWSVRQTESLYVSRNGGRARRQQGWSDSGSGIAAIPGLFVQGSVGIVLSERWSLSAFGRYDYAGDVELTAGDSSGSLELSGWSVGGGVTCRF
jgi:hypothetical protein